jgi:hypothetical protein
MTTELEQARAHLRDCQKALKHARDVSVFEQGQWWPENMKANAERAVLAALSWVWDAQERERVAAKKVQRRIPPNERLEIWQRYLSGNGYNGVPALAADMGYSSRAIYRVLRQEMPRGIRV